MQWLNQSTPTYPNEIVGKLREQILRGELAPGARLLPERLLAIRLGTNRNTLREALRILEAQGLVRARHGDGVRVLDYREHAELPLLPYFFSLADAATQASIVADMLRLRSLVAREVVLRATQCGTDSDLLALPALLQPLVRAHRARDVPGSIRAELDLYRGIVRASGSITSLWLFNTLERVVSDFLERSPGLWVTPPHYLATWRRILFAMIERDAARALEALTTLFTAVDDVITHLLAGETRAPPISQKGAARP